MYKRLTRALTVLQHTHLVLLSAGCQKGSANTENSKSVKSADLYSAHRHTQSYTHRHTHTRRAAAIKSRQNARRKCEKTKRKHIFVCRVAFYFYFLPFFVGSSACVCVFISKLSQAQIFLSASCGIHLRFALPNSHNKNNNNKTSGKVCGCWQRVLTSVKQ